MTLPRCSRGPAGLLVALAIQATAAGATEPAPGPSAWRAKVHPLVLAAAEGGSAEFLVVLEEQADLSFARELPTRDERREAVVASLTSVAARTQAPLIERLQAMGARYRPFWIANLIWVRGGPDTVADLARRVEVRRLDPNPAVRVALPSPTPSSAEGWSGGPEWNLALIGAPTAWALGYDGSGVVIGGQDTGYQWDHPALKGHYRGWEGSSANHDFDWHDAIHSGGGFCGADSPAPCDDHGHGTHTMGTMVGDDGGSNLTGVAPGARWIACRNMDEGVGTPATYTECFQWFVAPTTVAGTNPDPAMAPRVINNSWGCPPSEGCVADTLRLVVENTRAAGIVVVASAGNSGSGCSSVEDPPAIYEASLSVGATDDDDDIAGFSSRGPVTIDASGRLKPNVSAPGVSVRSSVPGNSYGVSSGTSMAGPHVAGAVALLLGARPELSVEQVETLIERSSNPLTSAQQCGGIPGGTIPNNTFGWGRLDVQALLTGDADGDGTGNLADCAPTNASSWAPPAPAVDLRLAGAMTTTLTWGPPAAPGASTLHYDLLRSPSASDFSAATCLVTHSALPQGSDGQVPGSIFHYLVRAKNTCGANLGSASDGTPRVARSCLAEPAVP